MRKTFVPFLIALALVLPANIVAQEVTDVPTAEVTDEVVTATPTLEPVPTIAPTPVPPDDQPGDEDDDVLTDEDITSLFGIPPETALAISLLVSLVIAVLKKVLPEQVGDWDISARGISIVISVLAWLIWWVAGRFALQDQFLSGLNFIVDLGPTILSLIVLFVGPAAAYRLFRGLHVPILGEPLPAGDEKRNSPAARSQTFESPR